jgi:HSP20 family protein
MSLVRYRGNLPSVLDRVFEREFYNDDDTRMAYDNAKLPFVNVLEDEDGFEIQLVAPGLNKSDFIIEVDKDILHLSSERGESLSPEEEAKYTRKEFSYTPFIRRFKISEIIKKDEITAKYENGILYVNVPKLDEAKPKPIRKIKVS